MSEIFAASLVVCLELLDAMKAQGVSAEERHATLERTLRASWPSRRPWRYLCEECADSGWRVERCAGRSCGREACAPGHEFVRLCTCRRGEAFRDAQARHQRPADVTKAGHVTKPSRWGR